MLIDIHVHCARRIHPKLTRPNGSFYPDPKTLIGMMDERAIDKACVMSTVSPEWRYNLVPPEEVLTICAEYPDRLIPFGNLDPRYLTNDTTANFMPLLEAFRDLGCKGLGECIPNLPFDDPLCMNFFRQVEESGFSLTFHIAPQQGGYYGFVDEMGLPRLEKVLQTFPNLKFLGHSQPFWAEIGTNLIEDGKRVPYPSGPVTPGRVVDLMRAYPNLLGDLSAGSGFRAVSRDPEFGYEFMEEFQDRLFWGTDLANVPQETPTVEYFRKLRDEELISREAFEKITWRNANRLLNLGLDA